MGRSITINCIGIGKPVTSSDETIRRRSYQAMNKTEIAQETQKAKRSGNEIEYWYAQTKSGMLMLGIDDISEMVQSKDIKLPKLPTCPICKGEGYRAATGKEIYASYCNVCRGSGICRKGAETKWQDWQLGQLRDDFK